MKNVEIKNIDESVSSLLANYAKLNELSDPQMDTVREAVKESLQKGANLGFTLGIVDGATSAIEVHNKITQKLVIARTFLASMSALVVGLGLSYKIHTPGWLIICTGLLNTSVYYVIDIFALSLRWLFKSKGKTNDSAGSQTNDQSS